MAQSSITVYVRAGDPSSAAVLQQLRQRNLDFTLRDIDADPGAAAEVAAQLGGRVAVPVVRIGDRVLVGYDPVQLARFLPADPTTAETPAVSFGAAVRTVTDEVARERGLPARFGVDVGRVLEGSVAERSGIRAGDIITEVGGYTLLGGAEQFRTAVGARRPGDTMQLTVWREGASLPVAVTFPREQDGDDAEVAERPAAS